MPNWNANQVTLRNADPYAIDRVVKAYQEGRLFSEFNPCPPNLLETEEWYNWCVSNWGTKWDVGGADCWFDRKTTTEVELNFESAWSPPIAFFQSLEELGFEVEAYFYEPGMCFFGSYCNGVEDSIDYSSMTAQQIRTEFPEMDERFCISEWLEEIEQENLNIDLDGGISAVNEQDSVAE